ncbi:hypothetical protein Hanom_Chr10g00964661 [Helianthus anomalus]
MLFFFFIKRTMNPSIGLLAKFTILEYTRLRTVESLHLGPKPVNILLKARQCGEVKPAQFNDRTSDLHLFA